MLNKQAQCGILMHMVFPDSVKRDVHASGPVSPLIPLTPGGPIGPGCPVYPSLPCGPIGPGGPYKKPIGHIITSSIAYSGSTVL